MRHCLHLICSYNRIWGRDNEAFSPKSGKEYNLFKDQEFQWALITTDSIIIIADQSTAFMHCPLSFLLVLIPSHYDHVLATLIKHMLSHYVTIGALPLTV